MGKSIITAHYGLNPTPLLESRAKYPTSRFRIEGDRRSGGGE